ncbi:MAG: DUF6268 family outer membrane beta-barrel protein [Prevotellaceae bacterium]|nr:DUF6268 family outer membrane beta-barrel protein [Prevotellaceae bacterium]
MVNKKLFLSVILTTCPLVSNAQVITDSLANDFRTFAAKNFSKYRTVNLFYETKWAHDYTLTLNDKEVEKRRKKNLHTLRFSTMIPVLKKKNVSLYANLQYSRYHFQTYDNENNPSCIFLRETYDYIAGGLNGSYYINLFGKPLILSASVSVDGWNEGWGMVYGTASAVMVFKNTKQTSISAGLMGMTLFSSIPIMPIVTYWHRFNNPNLSVDITMPSQFYLRYEMKNQRLSVGAFMSSDNFYLRTELDGAPEICYYSDAVLKPEINYEYIINKHLYLSAHAGLSMVMKGGLYKKNRKGMKVTTTSHGKEKTEVEPLVKQSRSPIPFFNIGLSYSLFK